MVRRKAKTVPLKSPDPHPPSLRRRSGVLQNAQQLLRLPLRRALAEHLAAYGSTPKVPWSKNMNFAMTPLVPNPFGPYRASPRRRRLVAPACYWPRLPGAAPSPQGFGGMQPISPPIMCIITILLIMMIMTIIIIINYHYDDSNNIVAYMLIIIIIIISCVLRSSVRWRLSTSAQAPSSPRKPLR